MSEGRIVFYAAPDLTIGDVCVLFGQNTDAYDYVIDFDEGSGIVIREGK